ncbi:Inositol 3-kinase [Glycine soja]
MKLASTSFSHFLLSPQLLRFIVALREMRKPKSPPSPSSNSTTPAIAGSHTRFGFRLAIGVDGEILPKTFQRMISICDHVFIDIQALICRFDNINGRVSHVSLRGSEFFHLLPHVVFLKASTDEPIFIDVEEVDPTGVGDCFLGRFSVGIVKGLAMPDAALLGNFFGSIVVAQLGPPKLDFNLIQYQEPGVLLWRGFTLQQFVHQCFGNTHDFGKGRKMVGRNIFRQRLEAGDREADIEQCRGCNNQAIHLESRTIFSPGFHLSKNFGGVDKVKVFLLRAPLLMTRNLIILVLMLAAWSVKRSFSIGASAVTSFGYRKDVDGQWVRKQDLPLPIPDERTPSPPPQRVDSTSLLTEVLRELHDLRAFVGECFTAMDTCLDAMDTRFDGLDTRITQLEDDMSFIRRCFDPPTDS